MVQVQWSSSKTFPELGIKKIDFQGGNEKQLFGTGM